MNGKQKLWNTRIDEWKRSGLSQRRYCEQRHLSLSTFQWWRARLREVDTPEEARSTELVEIPVKNSGAETQKSGMYRLAVEVGRYTVGLQGAFDAHELGKLLDLLESR
jgi:hypothetical protein